MSTARNAKGQFATTALCLRGHERTPANVGNRRECKACYKVRPSTLKWSTGQRSSSKWLWEHDASEFLCLTSMGLTLGEIAAKAGIKVESLKRQAQRKGITP